MKLTPIFNMNTDFFVNENNLPSVIDILTDILTNGNTYYCLPIIEANDLEDGYNILNNNHPNTHKEAVQLLIDLQEQNEYLYFQTIHTSMSIGDIFFSYEDCEMYICCSCEFKKLSKK